MKTLELAAAGGLVVIAGAAGGKLEYRENLRGSHPALVALYDRWNAVGTHVIGVAPAGIDWSPPGGLRTDESEQAAAAAAGLSKATDLISTPHGRGAAGDTWPKGFNPHRGYNDAGQLPGAQLLMRAFGEWAEAQVITLDGYDHTFVWGGRWGDDSHVQLADWRLLPFPPPEYA